jgi:hypothetical protein
MAGSLWVREIKRNKIIRDVVTPCPNKDWQEALREACHQLDIGFPVLMPKHEKEFEDFSQARFLPDHFLESVSFDRLEAEYFDPEDKSPRTRMGGVD